MERALPWLWWSMGDQIGKVKGEWGMGGAGGEGRGARGEGRGERREENNNQRQSRMR